MVKLTSKLNWLKQMTALATAIYVPDELVRILDDKKRIPVHVIIDNVSYQSTIVVMGGLFLIPVNKNIRNQINKYGGETVSVKIKRDITKRRVIVPTLIKIALKNANLAKQFQSLSFTQQKEYVNWINDAKKEETRKKRLINLIEQVSKH